MKCALYSGLLLLLFAQLAGASDNVNRQEAVTRLEQAVSKTNIFELPSFLMRADIQIEENGKLVDGTYELLWNGPDQWREGIRVPGYTEVQIGDKGTVRVKRSTDFIPVPIYNLHQALGFGSTTGAPQSMSLVQPVLGPRDTIKKQRERKEHGQKLTCFEMDHGNNLSSEICINDASGTIDRSSQFSDEDFQPVGTKIFPRGITFRLENRAVARVTVTNLASSAQFTPDAFSPPAGVTARAGCMNPLAPHAAEKPAPHYPENARQQHREGTVAFDVLIGKDGTPKLQRLLQSAGSDLDDSAKQAISRWRYDPAQCNGQPVEVETVLQVNYALMRH
jgi:TonB family protein